MNVNDFTELLNHPIFEGHLAIPGQAVAYALGAVVFLLYLWGSVRIARGARRRAVARVPGPVPNPVLPERPGEGCTPEEFRAYDKAVVKAVRDAKARGLVVTATTAESYYGEDGNPTSGNGYGRSGRVYLYTGDDKVNVDGVGNFWPRNIASLTAAYPLCIADFLVEIPTLILWLLAVPIALYHVLRVTSKAGWWLTAVQLWRLLVAINRAVEGKPKVTKRETPLSQYRVQFVRAVDIGKRKSSAPADPPASECDPPAAPSL